MTERVLAVIPARGGSKGVPRKNVRPFAGTPLVAHTVAHALGAASVNRTVVSTDDDEIAAVSAAAGAEVVRRPDILAGDTASSESALLHVLDALKASEGYEPDLVVFLQCTSPIRTAGDVEAAVAQFRREGLDSLVSATPWHGLNWVVEEGGARSYNFDYRNRPRRQDLAEQFRENGSIFLFKPWVLSQYGCRLGGRIGIFAMSPLTEVETDSEEGFAVAESIHAHYKGSQPE